MKDIILYFIRKKERKKVFNILKERIFWVLRICK